MTSSLGKPRILKRSSGPQEGDSLASLFSSCLADSSSARLHGSVLLLSYLLFWSLWCSVYQSVLGFPCPESVPDTFFFNTLHFYTLLYFTGPLGGESCFPLFCSWIQRQLCRPRFQKGWFSRQCSLTYSKELRFTLHLTWVVLFKQSSSFTSLYVTNTNCTFCPVLSLELKPSWKHLSGCLLLSYLLLRSVLIKPNAHLGFQQRSRWYMEVLYIWTVMVRKTIPTKGNSIKGTQIADKLSLLEIFVLSTSKEYFMWGRLRAKTVKLRDY